ncbi:TPA: DUF551 domain-containing protein [Salmonella enterica subsp. enterica serovar Ohio]|nr:DUF551 domain-containing protein [Salmonella enterica subsp. enterica serovar Ohio]HCT1716323.1 DUF551 domain-containing protein [Salmonella enterica subsp. enterica serovar Ohio]HEC7074968.1 DUF551 domain-containing protein [Salmonella enterica subsp. enterica serovar Ohio]HEC7474449.1 DUF551 domain-containing protein [Salmonella enterica subsp. enterica serovar Ohio]HEC7496788.1 DUF551 domain-containing protein [Salmonella enterica subsp. enterica serovar Ohio]
MTTITKEEVKAFIEQIESDLSNGWEAQIFELKLARIALASLEAEKGADPVVFTDERNLHHIAMGRETSLIWGKQNQEVGDIPLYRHAQPVPVDKEFIPKNLDKALGVVGVALPESKEEFNFQIERWIQRLIDRVIRYADEFKEQPAPVVPDEMATSDDMNLYQKSFAQGYNACRTAMLQGGQPVSNRDELQVIGWLRSDYNSDDKRDPNAPLFMLGSNDPSETWGVKYIPLSGSSPAIPDDWVMVPKEPTQAMINAWLSEVANWRGHVAGYKAALAAAPQQEVK